MLSGLSGTTTGTACEERGAAHPLDVIRVSSDGRVCRLKSGNLHNTLLLRSAPAQVLVYNSLGDESAYIIDNNVATRQIAATTTATFIRHSNGRIFRWNGVPMNWTMIDGDLDTGKRMAAGESHLFQIRSNGVIKKLEPYPFYPLLLGSTWTTADDNPAAAGIAGGVYGLLQKHSNGNLWKWNGGFRLWTQIDWTSTTWKVAVGENAFYQVRSDSLHTILKWQGSSWQLIDNNPLAQEIVARGTDIYQMHNNGNVWKYAGTPRVWSPLNGSQFGAIHIFGSDGGF